MARLPIPTAVRCRLGGACDCGGGGGGWWGGRGQGLGPGGGADSSIGSLDSAGSIGAYWRPKLMDTVPLKSRANVIIGAAALLYASLGLWLLANEFLYQ